MSSLKQQQKLYLEGITLKSVTQAYSEISATKLSKIRSGMENNIKFASELSDLYHLLRQEAIKNDLQFSPKIPGEVHLLITSNNRFYSMLERPLSKYFETSTLSSQQNSKPVLRIVVGKTGPTFLKADHYSLPIQPIILKEDIPSQDELHELIKIISQYQTVFIYHSRFKTVLTQLPVVSEITRSLIKPNTNLIEIHYIFEPELRNILNFFESQILQISLEQTFLESELARTAARLISMDQAETKANAYLKEQTRILGTVKRSIENTKMMEMISGLMNRSLK